MSVADVGTIVAALALAVWLAIGAAPGARLLIGLTATAVAAAMFLPRPALRAITGLELWRTGSDVLERLPWPASTTTHFAAFFGLSIVLWLGRPDLRGGRAVAILVVLACFAELVQAIGHARNANVEDVLVNLLGVAAGISVSAALAGFRPIARAPGTGMDR